MQLGFIGTGGIAEAMITGLYNFGGYEYPVLVSARNRQRSARLAKKFDLVEIVRNNQTIVDRCNWIVLGVLPEQALSLLPELDFTKEHCVISLPAGIGVTTVRQLVHPASRVCRAVPMPPIEFGLGPTPIYPDDQEVMALFDRVGTSIAVDDERHFSALIASTAVMATFFSWQASNARWLQKQGVPSTTAARYVTSVFEALAAMSARTPENLQSMSQDCLTPGGLNEQVLRGANQAGVIDSVQAQVEQAMRRLENAERRVAGQKYNDL